MVAWVGWPSWVDQNLVSSSLSGFCVFLYNCTAYRHLQFWIMKDCGRNNKISTNSTQSDLTLNKGETNRHHFYAPYTTGDRVNTLSALDMVECSKRKRKKERVRERKWERERKRVCVIVRYITSYLSHAHTLAIRFKVAGMQASQAFHSTCKCIPLPDIAGCRACTYSI